MNVSEHRGTTVASTWQGWGKGETWCCPMLWPFGHLMLMLTLSRLAKYYNCLFTRIMRIIICSSLYFRSYVLLVSHTLPFTYSVYFHTVVYYSTHGNMKQYIHLLRMYFISRNPSCTTRWWPTIDWCRKNGLLNDSLAKTTNEWKKKFTKKLRNLQLAYWQLNVE